VLGTTEVVDATGKVPLDVSVELTSGTLMEALVRLNANTLSDGDALIAVQVTGIVTLST